MAAITLIREPVAGLDGMDWGICPRCLDRIAAEDGFAVRVSIPYRDPIRFHEDCYLTFAHVVGVFGERVVAARERHPDGDEPPAAVPLVN